MKQLLLIIVFLNSLLLSSQTKNDLIVKVFESNKNCLPKWLSSSRLTTYEGETVIIGNNSNKENVILFITNDNGVYRLKSKNLFTNEIELWDCSYISNVTTNNSNTLVTSTSDLIINKSGNNEPLANVQVRPSSDLKTNQTTITESNKSLSITNKEFNRYIEKLNNTNFQNLTFQGQINSYPSNPKESKFTTLKSDGKIYFEGYMKESVISNTPTKMEIKSIKHGQGKVYFSNSNGYIQGYYLNDKLEGYGELVYTNSVFKGNLRNDLKHGQGIELYSDINNKFLYEGEFKYDKFNGNGLCIYKNQVHKGIFSDGKLIEGEILYATGNKYIGKFIDGKLEGNGTCILSDGNKYVGEFKNNKFEGYGTLYFLDGRKDSGIYSKGILIKTEKQIKLEKIEKEKQLALQVDNIETVKIGNQIWMKSNLQVTKFKNGDPIYEAKNIDDFEHEGNMKRPAFIKLKDYNSSDDFRVSDEFSHFEIVYNWYAVTDPRGLAPEGWRIPSYNDWGELISKYEKSNGDYYKYQFYKDEDTKKFLLKAKKYYKEFVLEEGGYYEDVNCPVCHYWTENQKKFNPCAKCKNKRWIRGKFIPKVKKKTKVGFYYYSKEDISEGYNESGFSGYQSPVLWRGKEKYESTWWSDTRNPENPKYYALVFTLSAKYPGIWRGNNYLFTDGLPVRCIKN